MILTEEMCEENYRRFIKRVVATEQVWIIQIGESTAYAISKDANLNGLSTGIVLLFWSDHAYAERARQQSFQEGTVGSLELFDFLFRWLTGMGTDKNIAGANWTGSLVGIEVNPLKIQEEILDEMANDKRFEYIQRLKESLTKPA